MPDKLTVTQKQKKSRIVLKNNSEIIENIKYPEFVCEQKGNKNLSRLCEMMNKYYLSAAENFSSFARIKLPKRMLLKGGVSPRKISLDMNYKITLCGEKIISVVVDFTITEGSVCKKRRFSQVWSIKNAGIVPAAFSLSQKPGTRKKILSLVLSNAKQNEAKPAFGYFGDYAKRLCRAFNLKKFFVTRNGVAFFVDAGEISPVNYGSYAFVIPYEKIKEFIKGDILEEYSNLEN